MINFTIHTKQDLIDAVETYGILPLFTNSIPGFSIEEHVSSEAWFDNEEGVWEWKGPVIRETGCAYGKFLEGKAVFISKKWFPDFANWRRDGYDFDARFDDELASFRDKTLFDLTDSLAPVLSGDLKDKGNYRKGGNGGFDTIMNRLQAQCYIIVDDFVYKIDKHGNPYGWGVARYSTPEKFMGEAFTDTVYSCKPEASYQKIFDHIAAMFPECDKKTIERFLIRGTGTERVSGPKMWLVPSNPKHFDIVSAFRENDIIHWKQGNDNIREGDTVFMYVGAPYSSILYRCEVVEADIPYHGDDGVIHIKNLMRIKKLQEYPDKQWSLNVLKTYDVVTVRATRSMPLKLAEDIIKKEQI